MYKNILLPVDLNHMETAEKPLSIAIELCEIHGAKLHVVTVIPGFGMSIVASYFPEDMISNAIKSVTEDLGKFVKDKIPEHLIA